MQSPSTIIALLSADGAAARLLSSRARGAPALDAALRELLELAVRRESIERSADGLRASASLYQQALAAGLDNYAREFLAALADCEARVVEADDERFALSGAESSSTDSGKGEVDTDAASAGLSVRFELRRFRTALPAVAAFAADVRGRSEAIRGGALLAALHRRAQDGDADVASAFAALLWQASQPFFGHVTRWMSFSELDDGAGARTDACGAPRDFFISRTAAVPGSAADSNAATVVASNVVDGGARKTGADAARAEVRVLATSSGPTIDTDADLPSSNEALSDVQACATRALGQALREHAWSREYALHCDNVPSPFIPRSLAESILAVGKAVGLLRVYDASHGGKGRKIATNAGCGRRRGGSTGPAPPGGSDDETDEQLLPQRAPNLQAFSGGDNRGVPSAASAEATRHAANVASRGALRAHFSREDSLAVSHLMHAVRSSAEFSVLAAECVVSRVRESVYRRLWSLLVHDVGAFDHIAAVRDYLLLGRGDFFQAFLEFSRRTVASTPATAPGVLQLLRTGPWKAAAAQVNLRHEEGSSQSLQGAGSNFERVSLTMSHRALRFECVPARISMSAPNPDGVAVTDDDDIPSRIALGACLAAGPLPGSAVGGIAGSSDRRRAADWPAASAILNRWFQSCSLVGGTDRVLRGSRAPAQLLLMGSAGFEPVVIVLPPPALRTVAGPAAAANVSSSLSFLSVSEPGIAGSHREGDINAGATATAGAPGVAASVAPSQGLLDRNITLASHINAADGAGQRLVADRLYLARPRVAAIAGTLQSAAFAARMTSAPTGAAWLFQPVHVARGFLARIVVSLGSVRHSAVEGIAPVPSTESPASFAFVVHRDHALALGEPAPVGSAAPGGGFSHVGNSLVVQVICKRLPTSPTQVPSAGEGASPFRVVIAVYGPPSPGSSKSASGDERVLLASGALLETSLPPDATCAIAGMGEVISRRLALSVEYVPPGANTAKATSSVGTDLNVARAQSAQAGRGRLRVCVLDGAAAVSPESVQAAPPSADASRRNSVATAGSATTGSPGASVVLLQHVVVDTPLSLEEVVNFAGVHGPGRGRAWLGLTADSPLMLPDGVDLIQRDRAAGAASVAVWLDALDCASYSDADESYLGLSVSYNAPWPLHLLLHQGSLAVYQDVFRVALRAKSVALALQEAWRLLSNPASVDSGAAAPVTGRGSGGAGLAAAVAAAAAAARVSGVPAPEGGVSAQLSGRGGKSSADPASRSRDVARRAAHARLQPVWLLRAQMQFVVNALLYHLQVDVIECAHEQFRGAASAAAVIASVSDLQSAHESFLRALLNGAFLSQPSAQACIARLLSHCDRFVALVQAHAAAGSLLVLASSSGAGSLDEVQDAFAADVRFLGVAGQQAALRGTDASSLLSVLDANKFFFHQDPSQL